MPAMTKPTSPAASCSRVCAFGVNTPTCSHRYVRPVRHQQDPVLRMQHTVDHAHEHHHADVVVEPGVDDERLQRSVHLPARRRDARDDRLEDVRHALAGLGAAAHGIRCRYADDVLDLLDDALRLCRGQIDLVEDRHHLDALLDRRVAIRHRLRFHALRGVDHQQRALARGKRARHFVGEIDVAGRVDQVELVHLPVLRRVAERDGLGLDGDAALALEIHRIQHLRLHLAVGQTAAELDDAVGERRLAVIDVSDDGEIADVLHGDGQARKQARRRRARSLRRPRF